jgi:hypothetical protein
MPEASSDPCIKIFYSASATYYAPSNLSGIGGMHHEYIRATPLWKGHGRYDCVFIDKEPEVDGFAGLHVTHVKVFFSFLIDGTSYPCALVKWFSMYGAAPCEETGLWRVYPDHDRRGQWLTLVVHLDAVLCGAHLIGVPGPCLLPRTFTYSDSLDAFRLFYVNKYIDYHAHELAW